MKWLQMCILQFSEFLFLDEYDDVLCNLYKRLHWLLRCIAIAPDDNMNNNNMNITATKGKHPISSKNDYSSLLF